METTQTQGRAILIDAKVCAVLFLWYNLITFSIKLDLVFYCPYRIALNLYSQGFFSFSETLSELYLNLLLYSSKKDLQSFFPSTASSLHTLSLQIDVTGNPLPLSHFPIQGTSNIYFICTGVKINITCSFDETYTPEMSSSPAALNEYEQTLKSEVALVQT